MTRAWVLDPDSKQRHSGQHANTPSAVRVPASAAPSAVLICRVLLAVTAVQKAASRLTALVAEEACRGSVCRPA